MSLTPLDIHNKEFSKNFRGYDEDEVNEFLDQIIRDYEVLIRQNREYEQKVEQMSEKMNHFVNIEESINKSIVIAQDTAEEVKSNAKKEATLIVKEAEKNADRIINDSLMKQRNISYQIEDMKKGAKVFQTRFRAIVQAQLELIENQDWDDEERAEVEEEEDY